MQPLLTVMFSTRNRSNSLRFTLEHMARLRHPVKWTVEFVVIDNGCTDDTEDVLREAKGHLPLRTLRCSVPGKSNALNVGLEQAPLGDLVVFTDDDVTPEADWLEAIIAVCERWPNHSVFGGRIDPSWPDGARGPSWADSDFIQSFAFTRHVIDTQEGEYPDAINPFGPNYWVRREAIDGMRFSSALGPRPKRRKLGQETEFLLRLRAKGHVPVYSPTVRVKHRIESTRLTKVALYARAFQLGRGLIYTLALPDMPELERSRLRWKLKRGRNLARHVMRLPWFVTRSNERERVLHIVKVLVWTGFELEALLVHGSRTTG